MTKRLPKAKYAVVLYQKINVTGITIYVENFIIVSKSARNVHYAALL